MTDPRIEAIAKDIDRVHAAATATKRRNNQLMFFATYIGPLVIGCLHMKVYDVLFDAASTPLPSTTVSRTQVNGDLVLGNKHD